MSSTREWAARDVAPRFYKITEECSVDWTVRRSLLSGTYFFIMVGVGVKEASGRGERTSKDYFGKIRNRLESKKGVGL